MSSRCDYFFRQRVSESELDLGFELLEQADRNLAADMGVYGIISGAEPTPHSPVPDMTVDLTPPGRAYDRLGQRIFFGTGQRVNCSVDLAGIPTDAPLEGEERWLGIFLRFDRLLSDPRTDGNSQQVFFRRDESFQIVVRQAPPGPIGSASKAALQPDELLVCDVRRGHGQRQILAEHIDTSRRQAFIFARAETVQVDTDGWTTLQPSVGTVQAALDEVDAAVTAHVQGTQRRHGADDIDVSPHGFVDATNVEGAIHELVDDLTAATLDQAGARKIGAAATAGTPHALPAGNVGGQISQLLAWLNSHEGVPARAHNASAIAAAPHEYVAGTSVQAQLQEIVSHLAAQAADAAGASRIGAQPVAGSPHALPAGTVDSQLASLLASLNDHSNRESEVAHAASAISVADGDENLNATDVEGALGEIVDTFDGDHFRGNEENPGQHRTIRQPTLGGTKALLWDAQGTGGAGGRLRVYSDADSVWFTLNAAWDAEQWTRDSIYYSASGFRLARGEVQFLHDTGGEPSFETWSSTWTLPMNSTVNSAFRASGSIREVGRVGLHGMNTSDAPRTMELGGVANFRVRFPAAPSSITLNASDSSDAWAGTPSPVSIDRDGFGYVHSQRVAANTAIRWFGTYTAIA